jgi:succinate-semialdehyde dehydrogenase/glutarate-semialdehyde dehydrogenase
MSLLDLQEYAVVNPATGVPGRTYPTATGAEIADVLARAHAAFGRWRTTSLAHRAGVLRAAADLFEERAEELAAIITREMGKLTREALGELALVCSIHRYYADNAEQLLGDTEIDRPSIGGRAVIRKQPIGALLGVMPWNFPYYQVARFAAPNLMAGNTIVLKHAPQCPESSSAIEQVMRDAGLLPDAYLNVFATNEQVAAMVADPRIAGVSVTGSERAGSAVAAVAGQHLKKCILELGGSDAFIVLSTDDLEATVAAAVTGRMRNAGQACNAAKRIIVLDELYEPFVERFTGAMAALRPGDPSDPDSQFGPLSSESAARTLLAQIDDAAAKGATVRTGGGRVDRPGAFVEATVLTDVTPDMRAFSEELFGPAAVVFRAADVEDAIALANATPFGLGGVVMSIDPDLARSVAERLDVGMVYVNRPEGSAADLPFGGTKRSGVGRELGALGIEEFVNKKLVYVAG